MQAVRLVRTYLIGQKPFQHALHDVHEAERALVALPFGCPADVGQQVQHGVLLDFQEDDVGIAETDGFEKNGVLRRGEGRAVEARQLGHPDFQKRAQFRQGVAGEEFRQRVQKPPDARELVFPAQEEQALFKRRQDVSRKAFFPLPEKLLGTLFADVSPAAVPRRVGFAFSREPQEPFPDVCRRA